MSSKPHHAGERRLLLSGSARRRLAAAATWLAEHGGEGEVLVVAASRGAADDLVRLTVPAGTGLFGVHRTTLARLATELATRGMAEAELAPLSGTGAEAVAARAIAVCRERDELSYFAPVTGFPGFPRALARTLGELRRAGVRLEAADSPGADGAAVGDLAALLDAYETALRRWHLVDAAGILELATVEVGRGEHPLQDVPLLLLDVSPEGARERELLRAVAGAAPRVLATAIAGDSRGVADLSRALDVSPEACPPLPGDDAGPADLTRLRESLFAAEGSSLPGSAPGRETEGVVYLSAAGEGRECIEVARRIHELASGGVPFDRIAVLVRDPRSYLSLLEEALDRADIPAHFTRGTVRPHPAGRAFLALLACADEGLSAARFAEYLSLGQVPASADRGGPPRPAPWVEPEGAQLVFKTAPEGDATGAQPADDGEEDAAADPEAPVLAGTLQVPRKWERLIVDAAVVGGEDRWRRRLAGLRRELELRLQGLDDDDETRRDMLLRRLSRLRNLEEFALPLIDRLARLPAGDGGPEGRGPTWGDWLGPLRDLATAGLRRPGSVLSVLAELEPMTDVGPVGLGEVRRSLEERLSRLQREPRGGRYGKVLVATPEEARGRSFHAVFLPGLAEGMFPRRTFEDPLLLDDARRALHDELPTREDRVAEERRLLRIAVGAAERQLVVSYPTLDALQGRQRVPSFYALDVVRAAEGRLPRYGELKRRAARASRALVGWPAPRAPELAVDAAEFDVAFLEPLLRKAPRETTGQARFLLKTSDTLKRSLRTRYLRWKRGSRFTWADGIAAPEGAAPEALSAHRLDRRSYSPTALQRWATCPYQFLLYAVHRLRPREEPSPLESMDPLTRGSLFHEVQYQLFRELRERRELPIRTANRDRVIEVADAVLDQVAGRYEEELAPAIPRIWRDEIDGIRIDLRGWIRVVSESDEDWVPEFFEFSFGLGHEPGRDPRSHHGEAVVLDGYRLRGSIDLVERAADGEAWRVTDHKTGRAPRASFLVVGGGEVLQPLLYGLAAEAHLDGPVRAGRLFYCTRRGDFEERTVDLSDDNRRRAAQVLGMIDAAIRDGFLPAAPRDRACEWCDYHAVCGPYEETRVRIKDQEQLAPLRMLRGAP